MPDPPFQLRFGAGQRTGTLLGEEYQLRLSPEIEAEIRAIRARLDFEALMASWLRPNWVSLDSLFTLPQLGPPSGSALLNLTPTLQPPVTQCGWTAPPGSTQPYTDPTRTATMSDLMSAVWALPVTRCAVDRVREEAQSQWRRLRPGERALLISHSALIAGPAIAGILQDSAARTTVLKMVSGVWIPVPGADGLSVRLLSPDGAPVGGGLRLRSGAFSLEGSLQQSTTPSGTDFTDVNLMLQLDLARLFPRSLR